MKKGEAREPLEMLVVSLLCLHLQLETLLQGEQFGEEPTVWARRDAVGKTVALTNEFLSDSGGGGVTDAYVDAFCEEAWREACRLSARQGSPRPTEGPEGRS